MESKKSSLIISLIVLLIVVGAMAYYLWPHGNEEPENETIDLLEFKVLDDSLPDSQKEKYLNQFNIIKQAIEKNPNTLEYWMELGMIKKDIGDYKGAEAAWVKAGEISPKNSTSFGNLADLYANFLKDYDKAVTAYQIAITNSANEAKNVSFYRNFFDFNLYHLEDKTTAEQVLLEGLQNNPKSIDLMILAANFYRDVGESQKAIEYYQEVLELDPEDYLIREELEKIK